jgi:large subunit ribosomal protein L21
MYAIIEDGGHQFRVCEGDRIRVDRRTGKLGDEVVFPKVLLVAGEDRGAIVGLPTVEGAQVTGRIVNQFRDKKLIIQKFRRRKNIRRRNGHRQHFTMVEITRFSQPRQPIL